MNPHVFAYGTLKQGQCRAHLWPAEPISIRPAWIRGCLFDRHDYPAVVAGNGIVVGEIRLFADSDIDRVMTVLDQIEGCHQPGLPNLYDRAVVQAYPYDGEAPDQQTPNAIPMAMANAYFYARDPIADGFRKVVTDGPAVWPTNGSAAK
ncbi:AIG2-like family protein [Rubripirellula lacrimiformis]|uniref:AIG2-like family protein n=1 Tax=Rubripirellula lacrimiformis TaxID=1930273 RepID=A0A517NE82_9BACT|nr:gamma-glutamylcyclotransferase family protein [Rubripirellula lacrimiformis]QDT05447.1 AIG2-like family protein [Rubripirellula lacrimiformis]